MCLLFSELITNNMELNKMNMICLWRFGVKYVSLYLEL